MAIHVAIVQRVRVMSNGTIIEGDSGADFMDVATSSVEMRVRPDVAHAPNTANWPTIKDYLIAEDGSGYTLRHMDNVYIVTQT